MPQAIQCRMPLDTFFYDEEYLLDSYIQAYYEDLHYKSWLQGSYNYIAHSLSLANAFSNKHQERLNYPAYKSVFEQEEIKLDSEQEARNRLCECY